MGGRGLVVSVGMCLSLFREVGWQGTYARGRT